MLFIPLLKSCLQSISLRDEILLFVNLSLNAISVLVVNIFHVIVFAVIKATLRSEHTAGLSGGHCLLLVEA